MKSPLSITQIASLIGSHKATVCRELHRNADSRDYGPKQTTELTIERPEQSCNECTVAPWVDKQFQLQWCPEQVASRLTVWHETLYQHVYTDKNKGGKLWFNLRCHKQKRKRCGNGRDYLEPTPKLGPLSERPAHNGGRKQGGPQKCGTFIETNNKQTIVTGVERKSGHEVISNVANKTHGLVSQSISSALRPFKAIDRTLATSYAGTVVFTKHWGAQVTLLNLLPAGPAGLARTSTAYCANRCPLSAFWNTSMTRKLK